MTFMDVMNMIAERKENILIDKVNSIQTDKHLYARLVDGGWEERCLPKPIEPFQPLKETKDK